MITRMERANIGFTVPTSISWWRMKQILFNPFDIGKWFVLGFTAWLATLVEANTGGGGGGGTGDLSEAGSEPEVEEMFNEGLNWVQDNIEVVFGIGAIIAAVVVVVVVLLTWVQSRGKLMFLDNVINNRALVGQPWKEYRSEGNSLFVWTLLFSFIALLIVGVVGGGWGWMIYKELSANEMEWTGAAIGSGIGFVGFLLLLGLLFGYVKGLLEDFVGPLMYQRRLSTTDAWHVFLSLHSQYTGRFVLYFFWYILLNIGWSFAIMAVVLITCCIAGVLMAIPYLGTVLILPMLVFFRALGPTFLRQFGQDCDLWKGTQLEVQQ